MTHSVPGSRTLSRRATGDGAARTGAAGVSVATGSGGVVASASGPWSPQPRGLGRLGLGGLGRHRCGPQAVTIKLNTTRTANRLNSVFFIFLSKFLSLC